MALSPSARIRVAVLGPVLVEGRAGSLIEPSGVLGKSLIAALALSQGAARSVAALVDDLWGDEPPRQAKAALQTLVSRVRGECADGILQSANGGYALSVESGEVDLGLATRLLDAARASAATGDHATAETGATTALALWRGESGVELATELAADLCARAGALHSELQRIRAESRIHSGNAAAAARDLEILAAESPLDEELQLLLMRALAASGRRNDALAVFAGFRAALRDRLGASPSQRMVQLNSELLRDDDEPAQKEPTDRVRIGLRTAPNRLVGREADLDAIAAIIRTSRLTTILGPGGLGKTRLAQELGQRASADTPAVIVVELASVRSGEDMTLALGSTLGIREASSGRLNDPGVRLDVRERILAALGERATLLVVDNCEHIVDAAAAWIADILASTTTVRVLATSRSPLAISGESVYQLDSLASDDDEGGMGPAVTLFMERARAARPGATLPIDTVARLCTRLDGLPLAIELAAARVRSMPVDEIERRLNNRFALLTGGERTAPERHRTLMAVIDWSWNLLGGTERVLLRRMSRFPDGFSADAAQIVGSDDGEDVTDALDGLVNQSLVAVSEDSTTGRMRYRMLETVREFGEMALVDAGEDARVRSAMYAWAHDFADRTLPELSGAHQIRIFHLVAIEQDNLVAVLRSAIEDRQADAVLTVYAMLGYYWSMRGSHTDAASFGSAVLRATTGFLPDPAHFDVAILAYSIVSASFLGGQRRTAIVALGRLRAVKRIGRSSDPKIEAMSTLLLATTTTLPEVLSLLAGYRESSDRDVVSLSLLLSAQMAENDGLVEQAIDYARRSYDLSVQLENIWGQATAAQSLANQYSQSGNPREALAWATRSEEGLNALQANGDLQQLSWLIAMNEITSGRPESARTIFESFVAEEDEALGVDYLDLRAIGWAGLAEIALLEGRVDDGLKLYRRSVDVFGVAQGHSVPWSGIVTASCISAHVRVGSADHILIDGIARRARTRTLAIQRVQGTLVDMPVAGATIIGISAWLLWPGRERRSPTTVDTGLRLLALSRSMGGRQDMPSLQHGRHEDAAVAAHGRAAVEAAKASVAGLSPKEAFELACELLRDRELIAPFADR